MSDSIEGFYNSIRLRIKETSLSPFVIIYFISWVIYNHEFPIYLFDSHLDAINRSEYLDSYIKLKGWCIFTVPLWHASVIFFAWVFFRPLQITVWGISKILSGKAEKYILKNEVVGKEKYLEIENKLTEFRINAHKLEDSYRVEIENARNERNNSLSQSVLLNSELSRIRSLNEEKENKFNTEIHNLKIKVKSNYHRAFHAEQIISEGRTRPEYRGSLIYIDDNAQNLLNNRQNRSTLGDGVDILATDETPPVRSVVVRVSAPSTIKSTSEIIFGFSHLKPVAIIEKANDAAQFKYTELV